MNHLSANVTRYKFAIWLWGNFHTSITASFLQSGCGRDVRWDSVQASPPATWEVWCCLPSPSGTSAERPAQTLGCYCWFCERFIVSVSHRKQHMTRYCAYSQFYYSISRWRLETMCFSLPSTGMTSITKELLLHTSQMWWVWLSVSAFSALLMHSPFYPLWKNKVSGWWIISHTNTSEQNAAKWKGPCRHDILKRLVLVLYCN